MKNILSSTLLICAVTFSSASAQRPDFSGRWAVESERPATGAGARPSGSAGSGWGSPITIVQDANRITVESPFYSRYDMQPAIKYTFTLDGNESVNRLMVGRGIEEQRSRAVWADSVLVITTALQIPPTAKGQPAMRGELIQRLMLSPPSTLVIETTRPGVFGGSASTIRTVYQKQGQ